MNDDQEVLELEIGQMVCCEDYEGNIYTDCEVIKIDELLNKVQLLKPTHSESNLKIPAWVNADDVFLEEDIYYV